MATNVIIVLVLTVKTIIGSIITEEMASLLIASFALAAEIIMFPYLLDVIRDQKYYSDPHITRVWVNPKYLRTKVFSFSIFIVVINITAMFTHKPNSEVYRITPLQYERLQNLPHQDKMIEAFKNYYYSSQTLLNNLDRYTSRDKQLYEKDIKTLDSLLWCSNDPEDTKCVFPR